MFMLYSALVYMYVYLCLYHVYVYYMCVYYVYVYYMCVYYVYVYIFVMCD